MQVEITAIEPAFAAGKHNTIMSQVFVSYSRKDEAAVRDLVSRLQADGVDIWFDRDQLRPGQRWEDEIRNAINDARAVVVCLSSRWVDDKGYVQKEFRVILEAAKMQPWGATWMVPVRLDENVQPPEPLAELHYVDLNIECGYEALLDVLRDVVGTPAGQRIQNDNVRSPSAFEEYFADAIERGAVIHRNAWLEAASEAEQAFKRLLEGRSTSGMDAYGAQDWHRVLTVWQPLRDNELFDSTHETWWGKPYFGAQVLAGQCQTFVALAQLGQQTGGGTYRPQAFEELRKLVRQPPYSMKGASAETLSSDNARVQNLNYKDVLLLAQQWFSGWSPDVFEVIHQIPADDVRAAEHAVEARLQEIDFLLRHYDETV